MSRLNLSDEENLSVSEPITERDRELLSYFKKLSKEDQIFRFAEIKREARLTEQKQEQKQKYLIGTRAYA